MEKLPLHLYVISKLSSAYIGMICKIMKDFLLFLNNRYAYAARCYGCSLPSFEEE